MKTILFFALAMAPALSYILTFRYIVRRWKASKRLAVWKSYVEALLR